MVHTANTKILAFVGLAGAGKSSAVDYLANKGIPKVYFGGILYDAMRQAGIEITPDSQATFREQIREREGKDFVVKRAIKQTNGLIAAGQHRILLDGLYTWTEYKLLKQAFPGELSVVAIVAPKHVRHHRLANRPERPFNQREATERDWREIEHLEKGGPIAIADHFIANNHSLDALHRDIDQLVRQLDFLVD